MNTSATCCSSMGKNLSAGANLGVEIAKGAFTSFMPMRKLHNENKIIYVARELFAFLSKVTFAASLAYGVTILAISCTPPIAAVLVASVALLVFRNKIAAYLPERITQCYLHIIVPAGAIYGCVQTLFSLSSIAMILPLGGASISLIFLNALRGIMTHVVLGKNDQPLDQEILLQDLQRLNKDSREIKHLEINYSEEACTFSPKIIDELKKLKPEKITLSGVELSANILQTILKDTTSNQLFVVSCPNESPKFNSSSENYQLALNSLTDESQTTVIFLDKLEKNSTTKKAVLLENIESILALNPNTILFTENCFVTTKATECLYTVIPSESPNNFFYYKPIDTFRLDKHILKDNDNYTIGYGEKLTIESVTSRLEKIRGLKLERLVLANKSEEPFLDITEDMVELLLEIQPKKLILSNFTISENYLQGLNVGLNSKADADTNQFIFYKIETNTINEKSTYIDLEKLTLDNEYRIDSDRINIMLEECLKISEARGKPPKKITINNSKNLFDSLSLELLQRLRLFPKQQVIVEINGGSLSGELISKFKDVGIEITEIRMEKPSSSGVSLLLKPLQGDL